MSTQKQWKKPFFTMMSGQAVSLIGSSAVQFALIWWLARMSDSPMVLAMAGVAAFIPQLFLGPFAGVWIDRMRRKTLIIAADLFMGVAALIFALWFAIGDPPYWSVFALLFIRGIGSVFHGPALQSVMPMLVPKEQLMRANGWSQFLQSGSLMLGPVLGAAMYAALPLWVILLSDFIGALAASGTIAVISIPDPERTDTQTPHFFREMRDGAAVLFSDRRLLSLLAAGMLSMVFYMPLGTFYPLMTSSYFRATEWHASFVELLYAAGMMLAAVAVGAGGRIKNKLTLAWTGLLGMGVTLILSGLLPSDMWAFWIFAGLCLVLGAAGNVFSIPVVAYMQEHIPEQAQGRAFSLLSTFMSLAMPVGLLVSGPVAERLGVAHWFFVTGIAVIAAAVLERVLAHLLRRGQGHT